MYGNCIGGILVGMNNMALVRDSIIGHSNPFRSASDDTHGRYSGAFGKL